MHSTHEGFVHDAGEFDEHSQGLTLTGYACRFRLQAYDDRRYAEHGVRLPAQLERAVPKRRGEFLAGRLCARRALARLGIETGDIAIGPDREPLWPDGVIASISHAGDRAVCIASRDPRLIGLGIDIERGLGPELAGEIRGVVVDAGEEASIRAGFEDFAFGLGAVFSAKESLYKALFPQVRRLFGFEAMRLARIEPRRLHFLAAQTLAAGVREGDGYTVDYRFDDSGGVRSIACVLRAPD